MLLLAASVSTLATWSERTVYPVPDLKLECSVFYFTIILLIGNVAVFVTVILNSTASPTL